ncbi:MAG: hypothetical protein HKN70_08880 [Gammaproteobacteria bacterium]|nr:hypothetical protein [Gammaproteobacteria bacterium]
MNRFVDVLREKNVDALAAFFPDEGVWTLRSTMDAPDMSSQHTATEVSNAMKTKRGVFDALIDSDGDTLRDIVLDSQGRSPWKQVQPGLFVPPDSQDDSLDIYVKWRREAGRWVIDVIGVPFA